MSIERISYHYFIPSTRRMSFVRWSIVSIYEFAVSQNANWTIDCWKKKLARQVPASRLTDRWGVQRFRTQTNSANKKTKHKKIEFFFHRRSMVDLWSVDRWSDQQKQRWLETDTRLDQWSMFCWNKFQNIMCFNQRMWISDPKNWETTL
jgi:hypothetical protein